MSTVNLPNFIQKFGAFTRTELVIQTQKTGPLGPSPRKRPWVLHMAFKPGPPASWVTGMQRCGLLRAHVTPRAPGCLSYILVMEMVGYSLGRKPLILDD